MFIVISIHLAARALDKQLTVIAAKLHLQPNRYTQMSCVLLQLLRKSLTALDASDALSLKMSATIIVLRTKPASHG